MNLDKETQQKIQELQVLENNLQNLMNQKQAFQLELNETLNALDEINKTEEKIYRVLGSIMLKTDKPTVKKELEERKRIIELRINSIEKQEKLIESKAEELKKTTSERLGNKE